MKRIFVTGAAGFTGRHLAPVLAAQGNEVHGLVQAQESGEPIPGYLHLHKANLTDPVEIDRLIAEIRPDHVVHLAAISHVAHEDVSEMYGVNVLGTRRLLGALAGLSTKPASILLASSANVYGSGRGEVLDESVPLSPANDYGVTKTAMEYVASIYAAALPLILVRPFNYTGRGQSSQFVISKIVEHARERAPVIELGNLDVSRDFSDVRMVVDAYVRLLSTSAAVGETFNVCSGREISLRNVLDLISEISGHRFEVRVNPAFVRSNEVRSLHGSRAKIESLIGPLLSISFENTLSWMLNG